MAEDQCLIQYFRDNFGQEFTHNYVSVGDDDDDTSYGLDYNGFTESSTFADGPSSPVTTLAPDLFGSPSSPSAMEGIPYLETASGCFSPPGEAGLQVPSVLSNLHIDRPLLSEYEYPMLASYGPAQFGPPELQAPLQSQDFEGITLDEILQDQVAASCKSSSSAIDGERATSFWRGKSPALLMQQLKGPSLSASSSTSEARSNLRFPSFQQSPSAQSPTTLAPRAPVSLTSFRNRVGEIKSHTFGHLEPVSMTALGFSRQRSLSPLEDKSIDVKFTNILSPGSSPGHGVLQSSGSFRRDRELMQSNMKQRREIMPGLAILGEIQRNAASGNNSWSSSSTSPGPSSRVHHDGELLAANFDLIMQKNNCNASVSPAMSWDRDVGGHRVWKKAKAGELRGCAVTEDAVQAAILATAMVEQKEKNQLREKFLALLQIDSATSKDYKAQILDDTIRYLKDVRRRLDFNEADSAPNSKRVPESGFPADKSTDASPTTSSRCRLNGEGFPSPLRLKDLELETEGVEINPHLSVDGGPHIEVRMMENQHVMVKLTAKDRPGFFSDIVVALRSLKLDIQHANIRTGNNGLRHDIFAAKMQLPLFSIQSTHSIAMALNQVISASATPSASPERLTPQI